jgi:hypothetical protein
MRNMPSGKIITTRYCFAARNCKKVQAPPSDPGEKISSRLISYDELLLLPDLPNFRTSELTEMLLRARIDSAQKEALRLRIFGT